MGSDYKGIIILIIVLFLVGLYGAGKTSENYYVCDFGLKGKFCIWWHQTEVGEMNQWISDMDTMAEEMWG